MSNYIILLYFDFVIHGIFCLVKISPDMSAWVISSEGEMQVGQILVATILKVVTFV